MNRQTTHEPWRHLPQLPPRPPRGRPTGMLRLVWPVLFLFGFAWTAFSVLAIGRVISEALR
jgi:hypothetical protein